MSQPDLSFEERLERAKLDAIKELAYGASHEINNPLANISARAQMLLRDERDPERRRALEAINQQALRAHEMISDLMLFARPPRLDLRLLDFPTVVEQIIAEVSGECTRRGIAIASRIEGMLPQMQGDAVQLAVALKAVVANSIEAIGQRGRVEISLKPLEGGANPGERGSPAGVRIELRDNGPGISANAQPHMFEPFYSGREAGRGLGFGLSKAWRIIMAHGGRIWAESSGEDGATFVIELPKDAVGS
jgi:signal transduction histidine kinase